MPGNKLNIAVCGLGWWGSKILRNCSSHPDIDVLVACDPDAEKRETMASEYDVETFETLEQALEKHKLDGVFAITPPETHYELVKYALTNNLHVVVAKPPTLVAAETDELGKVAEEKNLVLMTDATFCYSPAMSKIKEILDSGTIGTVRQVESIRYGDNLRVQGLHRLKYAMRDTGTDVIQDLAMHDLAIVAYLFGDGFSVTDVSKSATLFEGLADTANIALSGNNIDVHIALSWIMPERTRKLTICGTKGILVWDDLSEDKRLWSIDIEGKNETIYELANSEPLYNMVGHFLNSVNTSTEPNTGPKLMRTAMTLFEQINSHV